MNIRHLLAITRKEFTHILRDPATLLLVTVGPLFLLVIFVYALTADVSNVPVGVVDLAGNDRAAELIQRLDAHEDIAIAETLPDAATGETRLDHGDLRGFIVVPERYGQFTLLGSPPQVEIIVDGTEPTTAEAVLEGAYRVIEDHARAIMQDTLANLPGFDAALLEMPVQVEVERRFNPDLRAVVDFYPGLAAMVLSLPGIALALAISRENELGTMEQLVATPVNKLALLVGKLTPYLAFGMVGVVVILAAGRVLYDVPFEGSVLGYLILSFFFLFSNLGLGLLISVFIRSQQLAMIVAFLVFFVPGFFLSGIFFPVSAMPWVVRLEMLMLPVTHYVAVSKAMYLQGTGILTLWFNAAALVGLGVAITALSVVLFKKKVA